MPRLLVFGATGSAGKAVVTAAIASKIPTTLFIRRPEAVPQDQHSAVTIIKGDYSDIEAVKRAVVDTDPTAIIITTCLPKHAAVQDLNAITVPAIIDVLTETGRLEKVHIVYLAGATTPGKNEPLPFMVKLAKSFLVNFQGVEAQIADNIKTSKFLYALGDSNPSFRYTFVRMGYVAEGPSIGELKIAAPNSLGALKVVFADVGVFLCLMDLSEEFAGPVHAEKSKRGRKPTSKEPENKKQAQSRNAQRVYRERRDAFVRNLETRVQELTGQLAAEKNRTFALQSQITVSDTMSSLSTLPSINQTEDGLCLTCVREALKSSSYAAQIRALELRVEGLLLENNTLKSRSLNFQTNSIFPSLISNSSDPFEQQIFPQNVLPHASTDFTALLNNSINNGTIDSTGDEWTDIFIHTNNGSRFLEKSTQELFGPPQTGNDENEVQEKD
ncbi:hypothetical protein HK100_007640 [Physocladia obscura]|uniref:NAD(P)-binding domain-containing protein n=1 Tax=Physocladia obscura TaxID=109957 RepID=A0AAD5SP68_9FUNG|nr:hypothetical protein HK100_007640 [Physocladia obscura]